MLVGERCLFFFVMASPSALEEHRQSWKSWFQFLFGWWFSVCVFFFFSGWLCRGRILYYGPLLWCSSVWLFISKGCLVWLGGFQEACRGCWMVLRVWVKCLGQFNLEFWYLSLVVLFIKTTLEALDFVCSFIQDHGSMYLQGWFCRRVHGPYILEFEVSWSFRFIFWLGKD